MTGHALFNLWLAIGGGVAVPTGVGLFAIWCVGKQVDHVHAEYVRQAIAWDNTPNSGNDRSDDVELDTDRNPIAA